MELIKSYLPNQDKDYFLNKLSHITLAPLGHHDKSPHLIKRKSNFQGSQLVQWNYRTAIHFSTFLLLIPYNLSLYSQKTSSTISVPAFSSMVFDFTLLSGKTIRPAGFASAGYASERIQACGFEQSWVSIAGRFYYPWEYSWAAVGGGGHGEGHLWVRRSLWITMTVFPGIIKDTTEWAGVLCPYADLSDIHSSSKCLNPPIFYSYISSLAHFTLSPYCTCM